MHLLSYLVVTNYILCELLTSRIVGFDCVEKGSRRVGIGDSSRIIADLSDSRIRGFPGRSCHPRYARIDGVKPQGSFLFRSHNYCIYSFGWGSCPGIGGHLK